MLVLGLFIYQVTQVGIWGGGGHKPKYCTRWQRGGKGVWPKMTNDNVDVGGEQETSLTVLKQHGILSVKVKLSTKEWEKVFPQSGIVACKQLLFDDESSIHKSHQKCPKNNDVIHEQYSTVYSQGKECVVNQRKVWGAWYSMTTPAPPTPVSRATC